MTTAIKNLAAAALFNAAFLLALNAAPLPVTFEFWEIATPGDITKTVSSSSDYLVWDKTGRTPLMLAAAANLDNEVIYRLINSPIDVNSADNNGGTALMYAAHSNQNQRVLRTLINTNINLNAQDNDGLTALMYSTANPNSEIIKMLLNAGANVNMQDYYGMTALMHAVDNNNEKAVTMLLNSNADTNLPDVYGKTVYDYINRGSTALGIRNMIGRIPPNPVPAMVTMPQVYRTPVYTYTSNSGASAAQRYQLSKKYKKDGYSQAPKVAPVGETKTTAHAPSGSIVPVVPRRTNECLDSKCRNSNTMRYNCLNSVCRPAPWSNIQPRKSVKKTDK